MRCHDARQQLNAQRDRGETQSDATALQEHLQECSVCRAFQRQQRDIDSLLRSAAPQKRPGITTDQIMLAIQQQSRISRQLEDIRQQQQNRVEHLRPIGAACAALGFFTLSSIPLLLLAITIVQTDLMVKALSLLNGVIDIFIVIAQYMEAGITLLTRNNWLLSGFAFTIVVMMGMWLRLMRYPREA